MTLREMRKQAGLTQAEVARLFNLGRGAVCAWEKGKCAPKIGYLEKLASVYGVEPKQIIEAVKG